MDKYENNITEAQKPVLCRYCEALGKEVEMTLYDPTDIYLRLINNKQRATYQCAKCGAQTPIKEGNTFAEAAEAAYFSATSI